MIEFREKRQATLYDADKRPALCTAKFIAEIPCEIFPLLRLKPRGVHYNRAPLIPDRTSPNFRDTYDNPDLQSRRRSARRIRFPKTIEACFDPYIERIETRRSILLSIGEWKSSRETSARSNFDGRGTVSNFDIHSWLGRGGMRWKGIFHVENWTYRNLCQFQSPILCVPKRDLKS